VRSDFDPQSFDHLAEEYDFAASLERSSDFFLVNLPELRRRALDVGCGTGILARELAGHFDSVLAVDVSEPMLALARRARPAENLEYRWADANALDVEGSFDAIVSHTTFHHLRDISGTLASLADRLHGSRAAWRLLRFRFSPGWLDHLTSDRYLSEEGFRGVYGSALPGARFTRLEHFMGVVWQREAAGDRPCTSGS
jgi:SAM-dependent methyltransferase